MHLGHARTALVAWLRARKLGGSILMRIEDLDGPRVVPGSADAICRDHEWLGLDWDEGPETGEPVYIPNQGVLAPTGTYTVSLGVRRDGRPGRTDLDHRPRARHLRP